MVCLGLHLTTFIRRGHKRCRRINNLNKDLFRSCGGASSVLLTDISLTSCALGVNVATYNMHCSHGRWLEVATTESGHAVLVTTDRLDHLVKTRKKASQSPSFITVAGCFESSQLALFGVKRYPRPCPKGQTINLFMSEQVFELPVLVACGPTAMFAANQPLRAFACHNSRVRQLPEAETSLRDVYAHVLLPLSDMFCYFVQGSNGLRDLIDILEVWHRAGYKDKFPACRIIAVVQEGDLEGHRRELATHFQDTDFLAFVLALDFVHPPQRHDSPSGTQHFPRLLTQTLNKSRCLRRRKCHNFSITHFRALMQRSVERLIRDPSGTLDLIEAARCDYPVSEKLTQHISRFLRHIQTSEDFTNFAVPYIASSLILDSFPPGYHSRLPPHLRVSLRSSVSGFDPYDYFRSQYKAMLLADHNIELKGSSEVILRSGFVKLVEDQFAQTFRRLSEASASHIHESSMMRFASRLGAIIDSNFCLACLRRTPQYRLTCGQFVCEVCLTVFGEEAGLSILLRCCFICKEKMPTPASFKIHPPTAGTNILSIDGGGVRGIIPLKLLKSLEDEIDLPLPVQRFFKVVFGISSGTDLPHETCLRLTRSRCSNCPGSFCEWLERGSSYQAFRRAFGEGFHPEIWCEGAVHFKHLGPAVVLVQG